MPVDHTAAPRNSKIPDRVKLRRDMDAVLAALTTPWNSGQVEGHVTRVKLLKRMGFGRASFALLRRRILLRT